MVSDFDLRWIASRVWSKVSESKIPMVVELLKQGAADVEYIDSMSTLGGNTYKLRNICYDSFCEKYGINAIPVTGQDELEQIPEGYKGVIVPGIYNKIIRNSDKFIKAAPPEKTTLDTLFEDLSNSLQRLNKCIDTASTLLPGDELDEIREISHSMYCTVSAIKAEV